MRPAPRQTGYAREQVFDPVWLAARLQRLSPQPPRGWCVAWSGGADSTALLAALVVLRDAPAGSDLQLAPLRAVHVDHHLQPAAADFRRHCRRLARAWQVPLVVKDVAVDLRRGRSPEEAARAARYAALAQLLRAGEVLLTAQHAEDQLESVLLQLLRGGGVAGIAGMPDSAPFGRGLLQRPLLPIAGSRLRDFLTARGLAFIEDPSNADTRWDRNYLRRELLPGILARWPAAARTVARSARHAAAADVLLRRVGAQDAGLAADGPELDLKVLRRFSVERQRHALRSWIFARGLPTPDERALAEAQRLLDLREDAQPRVHWPGAELRRHAGRLYLQAAAMPAAGKGPTGLQRWRWRQSRQLVLPDGSSLVLRNDPWGDIDLARLPALLDVRLRDDTTADAGRNRDCDIKALLREAGIPAWRRAQVPLVRAGDALLAVADLWCAQRIRARPDDAQRARLIWQQR